MRYMAGYTAFTLLKKYKKISHIRNFSKSDRCLYVAVLKGMKADEADREDCTSEWTEVILESWEKIRSVENSIQMRDVHV